MPSVPVCFYWTHPLNPSIKTFTYILYVHSGTLSVHSITRLSVITWYMARLKLGLWPLYNFHNDIHQRLRPWTYWLAVQDCKQEQMTASSADMICGRPSSCRSSVSSVDSKLGHYRTNHDYERYYAIFLSSFGILWPSELKIGTQVIFSLGNFRTNFFFYGFFRFWVRKPVRERLTERQAGGRATRV